MPTPARWSSPLSRRRQNSASSDGPHMIRQPAAPPRVALATFDPPHTKRPAAACAASRARLHCGASDVVGSRDRVDAVRRRRHSLLLGLPPPHQRVPGLDRPLETARVPVINSAGTIRWNALKTYLPELGTRGVPIPPTTVVKRGATDGEAAAAIEALASTDVVIKPAVSATAYETWRATVPLQPVDTARLRALAARGDVIVQAFVEEIATSGELSLVFFDGVYSHAARKLPKQGDFRVQLDHGGLLEITHAPAEIIRHAEAIVRHAPSVPTYARVDGVAIGGVFTLMELEPSRAGALSIPGRRRCAPLCGSDREGHRTSVKELCRQSACGWIGQARAKSPIPRAARPSMPTPSGERRTR